MRITRKKMIEFFIELNLKDEDGNLTATYDPAGYALTVFEFQFKKGIKAGYIKFILTACGRHVYTLLQEFLPKEKLTVGRPTKYGQKSKILSMRVPEKDYENIKAQIEYFIKYTQSN